MKVYSQFTAKERKGVATSRVISLVDLEDNSFVFPSAEDKMSERSSEKSDTFSETHSKSWEHPSIAQESVHHEGHMVYLPLNEHKYLPVPENKYKNASSRFFTFNSNRQSLDVSTYLHLTSASGRK